MIEPLLSICIPTFNRSFYLDKLLENISGQIDDSMAGLVQVCVSNNASADDTDDIIKKWAARSPFRIINSRNETNIGFDLNIRKVASLADGKYCWFMGDDDLFNDDAIRTMLKELESGHDIYLCDKVVCTIDMEPRNYSPWLSGPEGDADFNFSVMSEKIEFFKRVQSVGAAFGFISTIIVLKKRWNEAILVKEYMVAGYYHVITMFSIINIQKNVRLKYIRKFLVLYRGDNKSSSLSIDMSLRRHVMDFELYSKLSDLYFKDNAILKRYFLEILNKELSFTQLLFTALALPVKNNSETINNINMVPFNILKMSMFNIAVRLPFKKILLIFLRKIKRLIK
jgi:abequosyltransferase